MKKVLVLLLSLTVILTSCTSTLQQDVFQTSDLNEELQNEISVYEDRYILIDSEYLLSGKYDSAAVTQFHKDIKDQLSQSHLEPIIIAHITAIDGLLNLIEGKTSKAQECYKTAKNTKWGDDYVLLLGVKLEKDTDAAIAKADEVLSFDPNNSIILMEKGELLYLQKKYDKAIALIDEAFIEFDNQNRSNYRAAYKPFRDKVWTLYNSGIDTGKSSDLSSEQNLLNPLTKESMARLTLEHTSLLQDLTNGTKLSNSQLVQKLSESNIITSEMMEAQTITRLECAQFLWNLYVYNKGKPELATKYTSRYAKLKNPKSPLNDVKIEDAGFDAVLGVVENEIMNLPDGKNFNPGTTVSILDYLTYLKNIK